MFGLMGLSLGESRSQPLSFLADSVTYLWPTDATHQISSTFAETRSAHLHAGLDIRTWGREGYKVFATRDGIVYRIATGPGGYGNVIYLKHYDGSFSVYAHLNRFEPGLQAYTDSIRLQDYSFVIDEMIEDDAIKYKKGELIGYTGSSGIGPPHLHFELRTPNHEPFNPLLTNLKVRDNIPPVFRQLGVEFLHPVTLKPEGYKIVPVRRTGAHYDFGTIRIDRPAGLSVHLHDRTNETPNAYAVYTITVTQDSDTLYHSSVDSFSYDVNNQMFLDRSYQILAETRRGFQRLYRVHGNRLPFYKKLKNEGVLAFNEGTYPLRIFASDIYGNQAEATVTLQVEKDSKAAEFTYVPTYPSPSETDKPHIISRNKILFDNQAPLLASSGGTDFEIHKKETSIRFSSLSSIEKKIVPGEVQSFYTPDRRMWIEFPKQALYDTLHLHADIVQAANEVQFNFSPDRLPLERPVYFNYKLPDDLQANEKLGLFSVDKFRNRLYFMGAKNSGGYIRAHLREISSLVIMEDDTPPWIGSPSVDRDLGGNFVIHVPVVDRQTGIDYKNSSITVNGIPGIVQYDPDKNILIYYLPGFRPSSENRVSVEVFDGMGNHSSTTATLSF